LEVFDHAECAFIAAYRREGAAEAVDVQLEYVSAPPVTGRILILCDPMLASGTSMLRSLEAMEKNGKPRAVHVAAIFASQPGIAALQRSRPDVQIWTAAVDPELNSRSYIVPGLGDAGDLAFGEKL
ncbi:MAG: uracil phosphoribosyltransferase, partial [Deltaproteobacteria bacterium]|nr:uracil phosphoribosyltransferase [Deltaproteobacteria bacterium]